MATGFYGFPVLRASKENHLTDAYIPQPRPVGPESSRAARAYFLFAKSKPPLQRFSSGGR
jgi:hypothetical protein